MTLEARERWFLLRMKSKYAGMFIRRVMIQFEYVFVLGDNKKVITPIYVMQCN